MEKIPIFNEQSLGDAIDQTFGKYGAHAEVYRNLLKRIEKLEDALDISMKSLRTYGDHPIIELAYRNATNKHH